MFQDETIESMVLDAFDELCADAGIEGDWAEAGPQGLALVPDPLRLGAVVDLWMRIENREQSARQGFVERMSILGGHQLEVPSDGDATEEEAGDDAQSEADAETAAGDESEDAEESDEEAEEEEYAGSDEPLLDEIELRGRLLVDVLNTVSQQLSERRGALELGESLPSLESVRDAMLEAINLSFADDRLTQLWENGTFISDEQS